MKRIIYITLFNVVIWTIIGLQNLFFRYEITKQQYFALYIVCMSYMLMKLLDLIKNT